MEPLAEEGPDDGEVGVGEGEGEGAVKAEHSAGSLRAGRSSASVRAAIELREADAHAAACRSRGRHADAVGWQEHALALASEAHGAPSVAVGQRAEELCLAYNALAMRLVEGEDFERALALLRKAEVLAEGELAVPLAASRARLQGVTFNNLGCFYKRYERPRSALRYLRCALDVERDFPDAVENPAGTHLNVCATLSELGQHADAAEHAAAAIGLLRTQHVENEAKMHYEACPDGEVDEAAAAATAAIESMMAIAFHNLAVEHEHLGEIDEAADAYDRAVELGDEVWGYGAPMATALRKNRAAFERAHTTSKQKTMGRSTRRPASASTAGGSGSGSRTARPSRRQNKSRPWSAHTASSAARVESTNRGRAGASVHVAFRGGGGARGARSNAYTDDYDDYDDDLIPEDTDDYEDDYHVLSSGRAPRAAARVERRVHFTRGQRFWNDDVKVDPRGRARISGAEDRAILARERAAAATAAAQRRRPVSARQASSTVRGNYTQSRGTHSARLPESHSQGSIGVRANRMPGRATRSHSHDFTEETAMAYVGDQTKRSEGGHSFARRAHPASARAKFGRGGGERSAQPRYMMSTEASSHRLNSHANQRYDNAAQAAEEAARAAAAAVNAARVAEAAAAAASLSPSARPSGSAPFARSRLGARTSPTRQRPTSASARQGYDPMGLPPKSPARLRPSGRSEGWSTRSSPLRERPPAPSSTRPSPVSTAPSHRGAKQSEMTAATRADDDERLSRARNRVDAPSDGVVSAPTAPHTTPERASPTAYVERRTPSKALRWGEDAKLELAARSPSDAPEQPNSSPSGKQPPVPRGRLRSVSIVWLVGNGRRNVRLAAEEALERGGFTTLSLDTLVETEVDAGTPLGRRCYQLILSGQLIPLALKLQILRTEIATRKLSYVALQDFPWGSDEMYVFEREVCPPAAVLILGSLIGRNDSAHIKRRYPEITVVARAGAGTGSDHLVAAKAGASEVAAIAREHRRNILSSTGTKHQSARELPIESANKNGSAGDERAADMPSHQHPEVAEGVAKALSPVCAGAGADGGGPSHEHSKASDGEEDANDAGPSMSGAPVPRLAAEALHPDNAVELLTPRPSARDVHAGAGARTDAATEEEEVPTLVTAGGSSAELEEMSAAATKMQVAFRARAAEKLAEEEKHRQEQERQREERKRAEEEREKAEMDAATVKLQSAFRARAAKKQVEEMRERKRQAEADAQRQAEAEAEAKAEAEAEALRQVEAEARQQAEADAQRHAEAEAQRRADIDAQAAEEARRQKIEEEIQATTSKLQPAFHARATRSAVEQGRPEHPAEEGGNSSTEPIPPVVEVSAMDDSDDDFKQQLEEENGAADMDATDANMDSDESAESGGYVPGWMAQLAVEASKPDVNDASEETSVLGAQAQALPVQEPDADQTETADFGALDVHMEADTSSEDSSFAVPAFDAGPTAHVASDISEIEYESDFESINTPRF